MGQQISRRVATTFEEGLQRARYQMREQARDEMLKNSSKKGFSDPSAAAGFTRGGLPSDDQLDEDNIQNKKDSSEMSPVSYCCNALLL